MAGRVGVDVEDYRRFYQLTKDADKRVRLAARKRLRESAKKFGPEIVAEGAKKMPRRGGMADYVAEKGANPTVSATATGARLVLGRKAGPQIGRMNAGNLRHPTFGRTKSGDGKSLWVAQKVQGGTWSYAADKRMPKIRREVAKEMRTMIKELQP